MYRMFTAMVTIALVSGVVIYTTPFIKVVTLGGTAAGAALVGVASSLVAAMVRRLVKQFWLGKTLELVGNSCILVDICKYMPGYTLTNSGGTMAFLLVLCVVMAGINHICLKINK